MRATAILDLVRQLLTQEAAESQAPASLTRASPGQADVAEAPAPLIEAAERASDKLRVHLSKRIGQEGFRVLLARALSLTTAVFPYLSAVRVGADGALVGLRGAIDRGSQEARDNGTRNNGTREDRTQEDTAEAATALIAQFLGLLIAFIGEDLTLRMLDAVWPGLASSDASGLERVRHFDLCNQPVKAVERL